MELNYFMYSSGPSNEHREPVLSAGVTLFGTKYQIEGDRDGLHIRKEEK